MKLNFTITLLCVLALSCKNADEYYQEGMKKADKKDYLGAVEDFTMSIEKNPIDQQSYLNRAILYVELKKYDQAILDYDDLVLLNPDFEDVYTLRGRAKYLNHNKEGACEDFEKAKKKGEQYADECIILYCNENIIKIKEKILNNELR